VGEPTKKEREAMAAANDRLRAASRFDAITVGFAQRQISVECACARLAFVRRRHHSSTSAHSQCASAGAAPLTVVDESSTVDVNALAVVRALNPWFFASPHHSMASFTTGRCDLDARAIGIGCQFRRWHIGQSGNARLRLMP
jgi:hypothetical protein